MLFHFCVNLHFKINEGVSELLSGTVHHHTFYEKSVIVYMWSYKTGLTKYNIYSLWIETFRREREITVDTTYAILLTQPTLENTVDKVECFYFKSCWMSNSELFQLAQ